MKKTGISKFLMILAVLLVITGLFAGSAFAEEAKKYEGPMAKYVFYFIGDGTGLPQVALTQMYLGAEKGGAPSFGELNFTKFPSQGITTTFSANSMITDSAPAGTTLASGFKTNNDVIGVDPENKNKFISMAALLKEKGYKVGILSTVGINHATPASFYAHRYSRNDYYEIALELPESNFDYFAGGGVMEPTGKDKDKPKQDIYEIIAAKGYKIVKTKEDFAKLTPADGKVMAVNPNLDRDWAMPFTIDATPEDFTLAEITAKGIEMLDNPNGFFMMVEGGRIDWACHANDAAAAIKDVLAFNDAIAEALKFYEKHPDETLIVVTGDHETGGLALGYSLTKYATYLTRLDGQKGSYLGFDKKFAEFKKDRKEAKLEDVMPLVTEFFGLTLYPEADMKALKDSAASGDKEAKAKLDMAINNDEKAALEAALAENMKDKKERAKDDMAYKLYGGYEPMSVALTHILDNKAGLGWSSYSHSGLPVVTYAFGVGQTMFDGYYDNSDVAKKIMTLTGVEPKQVPIQ